MIEVHRMIMGETDNLYALGLYPGDSVDDLRERALELVGTVDAEHQVLFLCDIMGGSPFNVSSVISHKNPNAKVIFGVNVPLLLEAAASRKIMNLDEIADCLMELAPGSIGIGQM
jgi:mannose/fructose/sorbose-specific phosphotransferase system IIA component